MDGHVKPEGHGGRPERHAAQRRRDSLASGVGACRSPAEMCASCTVELRPTWPQQLVRGWSEPPKRSWRRCSDSAPSTWRYRARSPRSVVCTDAGRGGFWPRTRCAWTAPVARSLSRLRTHSLGGETTCLAVGGRLVRLFDVAPRPPLPSLLLLPTDSHTRWTNTRGPVTVTVTFRAFRRLRLSLAL